MKSEFLHILQQDSVPMKINFLLNSKNFMNLTYLCFFTNFTTIQLFHKF